MESGAAGIAALERRHRRLNTKDGIRQQRWQATPG
jgi:hypothetical protein